MERTLLLNASYQPLKAISWRKAVTLYFLGKVEILEEYEREIRSVSISMKLPAVIRLLRNGRWYKGRVKFSRETVFQRDSYTCQYCHKPFPSHKLTCDHVIPRSRGGATTWNNVVTACLSCNTRKGNKRLEQAGVTLRKQPREPDWFHFMQISLRAANDHPAWQIYFPPSQE